MVSVRLRRIASFLFLAALLAATAMFSGCSGQSRQDRAGTNHGAQVSGTITVAGSTSVQPFSEVLAEAFMSKNPGVRVHVQGGGSTQGIQAAISGAAEIGASSRELKDQEKEAQLVETTMALDGIAVVVHKDNPITELTREEIKNIYLGNITNWKALGGPPGDITVVCREEGSGTRGAFEEIVMDKEIITNKAIIQNSTGAVRTTVAGDPRGIGFVSLASLNEEVKAVKVDGVRPSLENVKKGSYKVVRPFLYLTKGQPEGVVKAFIDFALSSEGQQLLVEEGAISVK